MGCKQSVYVSQDVEHKKCLDMLSKEPNLKEYQGSADALKKMGVMYKNQVYGCSVLLNVGDKDQKKRTKKNPLTDEINRFNVQHLYLGGFKELSHVKVNKEEDIHADEGALYCHIHMLVDSVHLADEKSLIMQSDKIPMKERLHIGELQFDDIKNSMNGYGRIIYFRCHDDHKPEHQHLEYIQEGKFRNGLMNGYCRDMAIIDGEAHCKLGFWKDGEPSGKYQKFDLEGNSLQEGIMEGETMKKEIKIQNFLTQSVKQGVKANYYKGVTGGLSSFEANAMGTFGTGGVQGMETKMAEYAMKQEMQAQEDQMKKKMENQFEHLI